MRTRQVQRGWGRGVQTTAILYTRVLDIGTADILGWTVLHWGGCSMHDRMVSIPGLYLLNASSIPIPQVWQLKMSPALARCPLRQKVKPRLRTNALDQRKDFVIEEQFFPFNNTPLASVLGINLWERHRWELGSQEGDWQKSSGEVGMLRKDGWARVCGKWSDLGYFEWGAIRICGRRGIGCERGG